MRPSNLAFAIACAVALPCGAALLGAGWRVCLPLIGVGLGLGLALMAGLDWHDYLQHRGMEFAERWAKLEPAPPVVPEPAAARDDRGWYLAIEITLLAGQVTGFTDDGLSAVMGSDARPRMQRLLAERGVLAMRPGSAGYGWADNVTLADALRRLRAGDLAPFPEEQAPEVRPPIAPATRRASPRRATTVIDGTARAAE